MNAVTALYPPPWLVALALIVLAVSFFVRAKYSLTRNGRLLLFVCLPVMWLAVVYVGAQFSVDGLSDPAVLSLALRLALLSMFVIQSFTNFLISWEEFRIRRVLDARLPGWRTLAA